MKKYSPRTANTNDKVCSLRRDNASYGDYWILVEEDQLTITQQVAGKSSEASVTLDKATFNKMIAFYQRPTRATP